MNNCAPLRFCSDEVILHRLIWSLIIAALIVLGALALTSLKRQIGIEWVFLIVFAICILLGYASHCHHGYVM